MDDLNRQGDYVTGEIGPDGRDILVGKGLTRTEQNVTVNLPPPPPPPPPLGPLAYDHPIRQYTLADVVAALIGDPGDPLTGRAGAPGLVSQLQVMVVEMAIMNKAAAEAHIERMKLIDDVKALKKNPYTQVFQILVLVIAGVILISFIILLLRPR